MAGCNHDFIGAYRHLLYRSMQIEFMSDLEKIEKIKIIEEPRAYVLWIIKLPFQ